MTVAIRPDQLAGPGAPFSRDLMPAPGTCAGSVRLRADGEIVGLAGWFDLELSEGIAMRGGPDAPLTHWKHQFLPLEPFRVEGFLDLQVRLEPSPDDRRGTDIQVGWASGDRSGTWFWRMR
jgi:hypothetical protein